MRVITILLSLVICVSSIQAECLKFQKRKSGLAIVKKRKNGTCPRKTVELTNILSKIDTTSLKGDKGDTGDSGTNGTNGTNAVVKYKRDGNSTFLALANLSTNTKIANFTTFEKQYDDSILKVTITTHVELRNDPAAGGYCTITPAVDGVNASGNSVSTYSSSAPGHVVFGGTGVDANMFYASPMTSVSTFENLSSGTHTIELWGRAISVNNCVVNSGTFQNHIIVEEIRVES